MRRQSLWSITETYVNIVNYFLTHGCFFIFLASDRYNKSIHFIHQLSTLYDSLNGLQAFLFISSTFFLAFFIHQYIFLAFMPRFKLVHIFSDIPLDISLIHMHFVNYFFKQDSFYTPTVQSYNNRFHNTSNLY